MYELPDESGVQTDSGKAIEARGRVPAGGTSVISGHVRLDGQATAGAGVTGCLSKQSVGALSAPRPGGWVNPLPAPEAGHREDDIARFL
jgi:hypothetical protein